jgi:YqaJ-like viral recombinase domain
MGFLVINCEQGSEEWHKARAGVITASMFSTAREKLKVGPRKGQPSEKALNYAFRLAIERISREPLDEGFETWQMNRGHNLEPEARAEHEVYAGVMIERAGFITTDDGIFGASADGFFDQSGKRKGSEYKCLVAPDRLRDVLLSDDISDFMDQVQGCMWISGLTDWHFGLYCPALKPVNKHFYLQEVARNDDYIHDLEKDLWQFKLLVDDFERRLRLKAA